MAGKKLINEKNGPVMPRQIINQMKEENKMQDKIFGEEIARVKNRYGGVLFQGYRKFITIYKLVSYRLTFICVSSSSYFIILFSCNFFFFIDFS